MADSSRLSTCRARSNELKPIAVSFDGHVKMKDPARFCSSPAAIHSSQCENFETGLAGRLLPTQRAASHKDSWRQAIAAKHSSTRPASVRRRRVTHFHPHSSLLSSALQARARNRSNCIAKWQRLQHERPRRQPGRSRTSPI